MGRLIKIATVAVVLVSIMSCAEMFEFNLFKDLGLDPVIVKSAEDFTDENGVYSEDLYVDYLLDELNSDSFVDELVRQAAEATEAGEETTVIDEVIDVLDDRYLDLVTNTINDYTVTEVQTAQEAAVAVASLKLAEAGATETVTGAVTKMATLFMDETVTPTPSNIITTLLPNDLLNTGETDTEGNPVLALDPDNTDQKADFVALILGTSSAADAYTEFAESLDSGVVSSEVNAGDVASAALVSIMVDTMLGSITGPGVNDEEDAAEALFAIASGGETDATLSLENLGTVFEDSSMTAILDVSGFGPMLEGLMGSEG